MCVCVCVRACVRACVCVCVCPAWFQAPDDVDGRGLVLVKLGNDVTYKRLAYTLKDLGFSQVMLPVVDSFEACGCFVNGVGSGGRQMSFTYTTLYIVMWLLLTKSSSIGTLV